MSSDCCHITLNNDKTYVCNGRRRTADTPKFYEAHTLYLDAYESNQGNTVFKLVYSTKKNKNGDDITNNNKSKRELCLTNVRLVGFTKGASLQETLDWLYKTTNNQKHP